LLNRVKHIAARLAIAAEVGEVMFVQHDRAGADEFFALDVSVNIGGQIFIAEHCAESLLDDIERFYSAAVVVFPMRFDELLGNAVELRRIERQRLLL
jgi:hypothetical protein